jgi:hypothetical protein
LLQRRTPLTAKKRLERSGPLVRKAPGSAGKKRSSTKPPSTLERKKPLPVASVPLRSKNPLRRKSPLESPPKVLTVKEPRASKLPTAPSRSHKGPERDAGFLAFVREQACLFCGTHERVEAHHFGKRGKGTKCSDYETVPLCHDHHVEGWHRHGTLPGKTRSEWLEVFRGLALGLLSERSKRGV